MADLKTPSGYIIKSTDDPIEEALDSGGEIILLDDKKSPSPAPRKEDDARKKPSENEQRPQVEDFVYYDKEVPLNTIDPGDEVIYSPEKKRRSYLDIQKEEARIEAERKAFSDAVDASRPSTGKVEQVASVEPQPDYQAISESQIDSQRPKTGVEKLEPLNFDNEKDFSRWLFGSETAPKELQSAPVAESTQEEPPVDINNDKSLSKFLFGKETSSEKLAQAKPLNVMEAFVAGNRGTVLGALVRGLNPEYGEDVERRAEAVGLYYPNSSFAKDVVTTTSYVAGALFTPETFAGFGSVKALGKVSEKWVAATMRNGGVGVLERIVPNVVKSGYEAFMASLVGQTANAVVDIGQGEDVDLEQAAKTVGFNTMTAALFGGAIGVKLSETAEVKAVANTKAIPGFQTQVAVGDQIYKIDGTGSWADTASRLSKEANIGELEALARTSGIEGAGKDIVSGRDTIPVLQAYTTNYVRGGASLDTVTNELKAGLAQLGFSKQGALTQARVMAAEAKDRVRKEAAGMSNRAWTQYFKDTRTQGSTVGQVKEETSILADVKNISGLTKEGRKLLDQVTGVPSNPTLLNKFFLGWHKFTDTVQRTFLADGAYMFKILAQAINRSDNPNMGVMPSRNHQAITMFENQNALARAAMEGQVGNRLIPRSLTRNIKKSVKSLFKIFNDNGRNLDPDKVNDVFYTFTDLDNQITNRIEAERLLRQIDKNVQTDPNTGELFVIDSSGQKFTAVSDDASRTTVIFDAAGKKAVVNNEFLEARYIPTKDSYQTLQARAATYRGDDTLKPLLEDINTFNEWALDMYRQAGRLSQEEVALIRQKNPNYTPNVRIAERDDALGGTEVSQSSTNAMQRRKGSATVERQHAVQSYVSSISTSMAKAEMMMQDREVFNLLLELPDEYFSRVVVDVDKATYLKAIQGREAGQKGGAFKASQQRAAQDPTKIKARDQLQFYVNGDLVTVRLNPDTPIARSLADMREAMSRTKDRFESKWANKGAELLSGKWYADYTRFMVSTLDATFAPLQWYRDQLDAIAKLPPEVRRFRDWTPFYSAALESFRLNKSLSKFPEVVSDLGITDMSSMSGMSRTAAGDAADQAKQVRAVMGQETAFGSKRAGAVMAKTRAAFRAYEYNWITRMEMGMRMSIYKTVRDKGYNHQEALTVAKDMSGNFWAKSGDKRFRNLYSLSAFANASLQGMNDIFRRFRYDSPTLMKYGMVGIVFPSMGIHAWNMEQKDEEGRSIIKQVPQYLRENNAIIVKPEDMRVPGDAPYWVLPVGFGPSRIFWNISQHVYEMAATGDTNAEKLLLSVGRNVLTMNMPNFQTGLIPDIMEAPLNLVAGVDAFGNLIVPPGKQDETNPAKIVKPDTSLAARVMSEQTGINPLYSDVILKEFLAGFGTKVVLPLVDEVISQYGNYPEKPEKEWIAKAVFPFHGLIAGKDPQDQAYVSQFWNLYQRGKQANESYEALLKEHEEDPTAETLAAVDEFEKDDDLMSLATIFAEMQPLAKDLRQKQDLAAEIALTDKYDVATPEREFSGDPQKKAEVDRLQSEINRTLAEFVETRVMARIGDDLPESFRTYAEIRPPQNFMDAAISSVSLVGSPEFIKKAAQEWRDFNAWLTETEAPEGEGKSWLSISFPGQAGYTTQEEINNESTSNSDMD
jgi:hypothetical protein